MEDEYNIKSYVRYRIVPLSMTLSDPEPQLQGHRYLKANIIWQTVHPIHSMSGFTPGFSGSANRMALFPVRYYPRWRLTAILE